MTEKIRCGGHYCEVCKRCLSMPRLRKTFIPDWWTVWKECEVDVIQIDFVPREECVKTSFKVTHKDIPALIKQLEYAYYRFMKNPDGD